MTRKSKYSKTEKIKLVEEFLDGSRSMNSFAKAKGVNRSTLGNWIMNYQSMGPFQVLMVQNTCTIRRISNERLYANILQEKDRIENSAQGSK